MKRVGQRKQMAKISIVIRQITDIGKHHQYTVRSSSGNIINNRNDKNETLRLIEKEEGSQWQMYKWHINSHDKSVEGQKGIKEMSAGDAGIKDDITILLRLYTQEASFENSAKILVELTFHLLSYPKTLRK